MVGIFSRFSVGRSSHRRTQSAIDERETLPSTSSDLVTATSGTASSTHGIEIATEFKPVEHPIEPLNNDLPIQCPLPEPSILNDGRIWKERMSASMRRRGDNLPIIQDEIAVDQPRPNQRDRFILPSLSAPEHDLLNILEECKAAGSI